MDEQKILELLEKMQGQMLGMNIVLQALLLTHQDPRAAVVKISEKLDEWQTSGLYSSASDATLQGIEDGVGRAIAAVVRPD